MADKTPKGEAPKSTRLPKIKNPSQRMRIITTAAALLGVPIWIATYLLTNNRVEYLPKNAQGIESKISQPTNSNEPNIINDAIDNSPQKYQPNEPILDYLH